MSPNQLREIKSESSGNRPTESAGFIFDIGQDFISEASFRKEYNVLYVVGDEHFNLLKIYLKHPLIGKVIGDKINLKSANNEFYRIKRISLNQIPPGTVTDLEEMIKKIVEMEERTRFVKFFNEAKPITLKLHQLKLLPGVGHKRMWAILDARKTKLFESYKDIEERTGCNAPQVIVKRILEELTGNEKHILFTK
ncbi:MAG: DUF655 domain-containing protein [Candidatus Thorarchaeota archaeon]